MLVLEEVVSGGGVVVVMVVVVVIVVVVFVNPYLKIELFLYRTDINKINCELKLFPIKTFFLS